MIKVTFIGAGSTIFAKNVLGDCILTPEIGNFEIALYDIDLVRLEESRAMLENINKKYHGKAKIIAHTDRLEALRGANFVINAIQVGGYEPCTVTDFEIPKKYGLRQTIGDTLGIGGIFRALRTIPVLERVADDIHKVCPDALFINYSNPMAMLSGYIQNHLDLNAVGLCHSVQICVPYLLQFTGLNEYIDQCKYEIAGINHAAWLLYITDLNGHDLYPLIKERSRDGIEYHEWTKLDKVRFDLMNRFGYYNTESSEHTAEYYPYYIKSKYPELIDQYNIPLDEYPRRCKIQIDCWHAQRDQLLNGAIEHVKSREFAAGIINAVINDTPYKMHGNVLNKGLITNLPTNCCVEVPCLVDRTGVHPCYVGDLPEQLACLNRTNINVQNMTIAAAKQRKRELVYMAAYFDPHTSAELSLDEIKSLCDDLFEAHGNWLPQYTVK